MLTKICEHKLLKSLSLQLWLYKHGYRDYIFTLILIRRYKYVLGLPLNPIAGKKTNMKNCLS